VNVDRENDRAKNPKTMCLKDEMDVLQMKDASTPKYKIKISCTRKNL